MIIASATSRALGSLPITNYINGGKVLLRASLFNRYTSFTHKEENNSLGAFEKKMGKLEKKTACKNPQVREHC